VSASSWVCAALVTACRTPPLLRSAPAMKMFEDGGLLLVGEPAPRGHVRQRRRHVPNRDAGGGGDVGQAHSTGEVACPGYV
jgi:hypothetical protein